MINRFANFISEKIFKKGKLSLSKKIKNSVKSAVKFINIALNKLLPILLSVIIMIMWFVGIYTNQK